MTTTTLADVPLTGSWQDLIATHASAGGSEAIYQNVGNGAIALVAGGASAPSGKSGNILLPGASVQLNNANIWARSLESSGAVSVLVQS